MSPTWHLGNHTKCLFYVYNNKKTGGNMLGKKEIISLLSSIDKKLATIISIEKSKRIKTTQKGDKDYV